jgi:hypothetical protein
MHAVEWEDWKDIPADQLLSTFKTSHKFKPVGRVSYADALWAQEGCGLYIFHDMDWSPWYLGKVASRSFLERISGHMDTHAHKGGSHTGWFNTFHKRWADYLGQPDEVAKCSYLNCAGLMILRMPATDKKEIARAEKYLMHVLDPKLNRRTKITKKSKFVKLLEHGTSGTGELITNF